MQHAVRLAACAAAALLSALGAAQAQERVEVPVTGVTLSDGTPRFTIPVMVGNTTIVAALDSGSTGLRVLPGILRAGDAKDTGEASTYSYTSGVELTGAFADATVSIGGLTKPVKIQSVHTVSCLPNMPTCPASRISAKEYGIQGNGLKGEGFKAIIGVNMGEAAAPNPLQAIGAKRWIMELPVPGSTRPGRLILNPTAEDMSGYILFRIDPAFAKVSRASHDAIAACLVNVKTLQKECAPTYLDCGAPGIQAINLTGSGWQQGTPAMIAFMRDGKEATAAMFTTGQQLQGTRLNFVNMPNVKIPQISAGVAPYFAYAVLYDPEAGVVGLKPRTDATIPTIVPK